MDSQLNKNAYERQAKLYKWIERHSEKKPPNVRLVMKRTIGTAVQITAQTAQFDFAELSSGLYFLCRDLDTEQFTRAYEAQVELAAIHPEQFEKSLHKFYMQMARKIRKENLYAQFLQFLSTCAQVRYEKDKDSKAGRIAEIYQDILMQQMPYLEPDMDTQKVIVGLSSSGELLRIDDFWPNLDIPATDLTTSDQVQKKIGDRGIDAVVAEVYRRAGMSDITSLHQLELLTMQNNLFCNQHCMMAPYINEETINMIPTADETIEPILKYAWQLEVDVDIEELRESLRHRARAIPPGGLTFEFAPKDDQRIFAKSVKFCEVFSDEEVVMLYRLNTADGDTPGYYKSASGTFTSITRDVLKPATLFGTIEKFILYLYAAAVTRNGAHMLKDATEHIRFVSDFDGPIPYTLQAVAEPQTAPAAGDVKRPGLRLGDENYEYTLHSMGPIIRRLPAGKKASDEAKALALRFGYELEEDETFVRPHNRNVLHLKAK